MSRNGVPSTVPFFTIRIRPGCSTTKTRAWSPGGVWRSSGLEKPLAKRTEVSAGVPETGDPAEQVPDEGEGDGVGLVSSLPQAARTRSRYAAARRRSTSVLRSGAADGLGEYPELPHREVGDVAEERGRLLLVDVVADALQDPAEHEERERDRGRNEPAERVECHVGDEHQTCERGIETAVV